MHRFYRRKTFVSPNNVEINQGPTNRPPQLNIPASSGSFEWNFTPSPMQPEVSEVASNVSRAAGGLVSQQAPSERGFVSPPRSPPSKTPFTIKAQPKSGAAPLNQPTDDNVMMDIDDLTAVAASYQQYSLDTAADRKHKQLGPNIRSITERHVFDDSVVLIGEVAKVSIFNMLSISLLP
jgi:hypothetical protein